LTQKPHFWAWEQYIKLVTAVLFETPKDEKQSKSDTGEISRGTSRLWTPGAADSAEGLLRMKMERYARHIKKTPSIQRYVLCPEPCMSVMYKETVDEYPRS